LQSDRTETHLAGAATALREANEGNSFIDDGKNTIASQLVSRLREAIVSGQLEAGTKIDLDNARKRFQVSLSPLREALARLISDRRSVNKATMVKPTTLIIGG
jgi:DNA-binding GntR family transcriptional regulator